jgi:tetratricopeptide (TPR) repeat protein
MTSSNTPSTSREARDEAAHAAVLDSAIQSGETAERGGDYLAAAAAYETLTQQSDPGMQAEGHFRMGVVAWKQNRFDIALQRYVLARDLARQAERRDLEARAENGVGAVHYARGEYTQARASYMVALDLVPDPGLRGRFLLNLGVLANIQGDLDGALEHYLRARALFRDHGDEANEALALHNLQMLHADRREWDDAEQTATEALALLERLGDQATIAEVLRDRSEVLAARGDMLEAIRNCQLAASVFTELGNELGRAESELLRGRYLRMSGYLDESERSLTDAYRTAKHFRAKLAEAEACRQLAALHRARADARLADRWRERALKLFTELGAQREIASLERGAD